MRPRSDFLTVLVERGHLADCSDLAALDRALLAGPITGYIGYDATAPSLHAGHLLNIVMMRWFQRTGNRPIALMGGGTTRVGDPSFRSEERPLLTQGRIAENIAGIRGVFGRILDLGEERALMLDNAEWLSGLNHLDFLQEVGRHFTVSRMLSMDSVRTRLDREQSLSLLEFNYMVLQAFDFLELRRRHGCVLQMGGSDQWGNIVNGIELTRRADGRQVFGLTTPLLTTSAGVKMGKSGGQAVWLSADQLSPFGFWQFWRNAADEDAGRFLRLFTEIPLDECERLGALRGSEANAAKEALADAVTALVHGEAAAAQARDTARAVFSGGGAAEGLDTVLIPAADLEGLTALRALVLSGLVPSGKEARRAISEGSFRIADEAVRDPGAPVDAGALSEGLRVSIGRKRHKMLRAA